MREKSNKECHGRRTLGGRWQFVDDECESSCSRDTWCNLSIKSEMQTHMEPSRIGLIALAGKPTSSLLHGVFVIKDTSSLDGC